LHVASLRSLCEWAGRPTVGPGGVAGAAEDRRGIVRRRSGKNATLATCSGLSARLYVGDTRAAAG